MTALARIAHGCIAFYSASPMAAPQPPSHRFNFRRRIERLIARETGTTRRRIARRCR